MSAGEKVYRVICHGCGLVHEIRAYFLSVPTSIASSAGEVLPTHGCPDCLEAKRIGKAWEAMTSGAAAWEAYKAEHWRAA